MPIQSRRHLYLALFGVLLILLVPAAILYEYKLHSPSQFFRFTPIQPRQQLLLEGGLTGSDNTTGRIIDLIAPVGRGQRSLVVAPPKSGKTRLLLQIGRALQHNYPDMHIMFLLVDERPEEITDIQEQLNADIYAASFDLPATQQVAIAETALLKARSLVSDKKDVVLLVDSITRLARAYNMSLAPSGKTLGHGMDASAMIQTRQFFGTARNLDEGGSLTMIATALVDTGNPQDDMIYEELKGTGNMEIQLEPTLAQQRVFPAINPLTSGTRREELLLPAALLPAIHDFRREIAGMDTAEAMQFIIDRVRSTPDNRQFLELLEQGSHHDAAGKPADALPESDAQG